MSDRKKTIYYIGITLVISFIYQGYIAATVPDVSSEKFLNLALILMYFPAVIALAFIAYFRSGFKIGLKFGKPIYLIYSLIIPFILITIYFVAVSIFNFGTQSIIVLKNSQIIFIGKPAVSPIQFILLFIFNFTLGSIFTGLFTIGEELGWRGYLQPKMIRAWGLIPGIVSLGLVWGYWHLPIILMGYNFPQYPRLGGFVLMPLMTVGFSGVFAWLTVNADSILPAILAHGAINSLLSDAFIDQIDLQKPLAAYLLLCGIWLLAGIAALLRLRHQIKHGELAIAFR